MDDCAVRRRVERDATEGEFHAPVGDVEDGVFRPGVSVQNPRWLAVSPGEPDAAGIGEEGAIRELPHELHMGMTADV